MENQTAMDIKVGDKIRLTPSYLRKHAAHHDIEYTVTSIARYTSPNGNGTVRTRYQIHDESLGGRAGYHTCARDSLKLMPLVG